MYTVVGIRFKKAGKIYYFDPLNIEIDKGDFGIVETARGIEFGEVVVGKKQVTEEEIVAPLKPVIRKATPEDIEKHKVNKARAKEAFGICAEKVIAHKLDMKLIDVEYTFDNNKVIFYFTADGRVDFRELVKDLASIFRTRIELRQIGVRDEAKMVGGYGCCGRPLCCGTFLGDFAPVSIKMAKEQGLSLNPTKISGACGRLMCCLNYESECYKHCLKKLPKKGEVIETTRGMGVVIEVQTLNMMLRVKTTNAEGFDEIITISSKEIVKRNIDRVKIQEDDEYLDEEMKKELKNLEDK